MITILHGDDITASRSHLLEKKQAAPGTVTLTTEQLNLTDLAQIFEGEGLFEETKTVCIEDFFTKRKKGKEQDAILTYLLSQGAHHDIVFWEKKQLTPSVLKLVKGARVIVFKLPQEIFSFLDGIRPGNAKQSMETFHKALKNTEAEMLFYMLIRQFRILLALKDPKPTIDEAERLQPWQKTKLLSQSRTFDVVTLRKKYKALYEIDLQQKTGENATALPATIDFFLSDL